MSHTYTDRRWLPGSLVALGSAGGSLPREHPYRSVTIAVDKDDKGTQPWVYAALGHWVNPAGITLGGEDRRRRLGEGG